MKKMSLTIRATALSLTLLALLIAIFTFLSARDVLAQKAKSQEVTGVLYSVEGGTGGGQIWTCSSKNVRTSSAMT
jgi:hypothetical protein